MPIGGNCAYMRPDMTSDPSTAANTKVLELHSSRWKNLSTMCDFPSLGIADFAFFPSELPGAAESPAPPLSSLAGKVGVADAGRTMPARCSRRRGQPAGGGSEALNPGTRGGITPSARALARGENSLGHRREVPRRATCPLAFGMPMALGVPAVMAIVRRVIIINMRFFKSQRLRSED